MGSFEDCTHFKEAIRHFCFHETLNDLGHNFFAIQSYETIINKMALMSSGGVVEDSNLTRIIKIFDLNQKMWNFYQS